MFISTPPPPPVDMVAVSYVRDETYRFTITNDSGHADMDPAINMWQGNRIAWGDKNVIVPKHGKWSVTIKFPTEGKWSMGTVDSLQPGNADTEYSEYAMRWNHLRSLNVR